MKKIKFMYKPLIGVMLLSLVIIFYAAKPGQPSSAKVKIEYSKAIQSIESVSLKGKVVLSFAANYRKNLKRENTLKMAEKLTGISGKSLNLKEMKTMKNGLMVLRNEKDPSASFEMDSKSGSFLYNGGLAAYKKDNNTPNLLKRENAKSMALRHLKQLGLKFNKKELRLANVGGLNMGVLKKDGSTEIFKKLVTVRFDRTLSGLPVMGASRIVVHMGENGKLAGLIYNWPEIGKGKKHELVHLRADKEIRTELESRLRKGAAGAERIIVKKADLVLFDDGKGVIEPAYYVQAKTFYKVSGRDKQGKEVIENYDVPYDYYIPVLKTPAAFYPYMEKCKVKPTEPNTIKTSPKDDE